MDQNVSQLREMLVGTPAVQQLQQGCTRLGLHPDMALELVCFLRLKRSFSPGSGNHEPQDLLPSSRLDQVWRWMLLNTKVCH
jgi:hypothetical protein